jgi:Flp pilus assembly protein protease CpaA
LIRTGPGHDHHDGVAQLLWATCAALVLLFIGLAALEVVGAGDVVPLTVVIVVLAALWSAHEWLGLWRDERRGR